MLYLNIWAGESLKIHPFWREQAFTTGKENYQSFVQRRLSVILTLSISYDKGTELNDILYLQRLAMFTNIIKQHYFFSTVHIIDESLARAKSNLAALWVSTKVSH